MKAKTLVLSLLAAMASAVEAAPASGPLTVEISVDSVYIPRKHSDMGIRMFGSWGRWGQVESCDNATFKGAFEGGSVKFKVKATGGSGRGYKHDIVSTFNDSFKLSMNHDRNFNDHFSGASGTFTMKLPELADAVPFVQQTVLVHTKDSAGNVAVTSKTFNISRPVILRPSADNEARGQACFQRYAAYEAMTGVLSNASNNLSTIEIKQGLQRMWTSTHGWQWGVFVSPLSALGLGNLIVFNFSYFQETSKTITETTEVTTQYNFDPGDYMQVFAQPTRYVTPYDAVLVDACGQTNTLPNSFMFQWWGFAYHVYPVNPFSTEPTPIESIGAPIMNSCSDELTPDSGGSNFRRTN